MVVNWRGGEAEIAMRVAAAKGLNRAATALMAESQTRVPVDTTDLRNSAAIHDASPSDLTAAVTYATPYAVVQHERLDYNHPTEFQAGAQAKYLERPAAEMRSELGKIVAATIRREMGS